MRFFRIATLFLLTISAFAQENKIITVIDSLTEVDNINSLVKDSLFLVNHHEATLIDSLWLSPMYHSPLYVDFQYVDPYEEMNDTTYNALPTELLKERLAELNSRTPFHVEYNPALENVIKFYLKTRKETLADLMGKAAYYFPMFEEHLVKYDLPLEIKYLAIVESALKPRARSRVGASGLWQFMYYTGRQFNLDVNSYVDERYDPIRATEAACKYLVTLHNIFGDWELALAAYNSGPGNVSKAIRRSGGNKNFWNIRRFLPRETAGYVPSFYATYYILEYAKEHNIKPKKIIANRFETDTITVKRQITFDQINRVLGTDDDLLEFLNPQYKLNIIPNIKGKNYYLRLPKDLIGTFVSNEEKIYAFAEADDAKREKPLPKIFETPERITYRVRSGDYLGRIAIRYGVTVSQIKRWNGLRSNNLKVGQRLSIYPKRAVTSNISQKKSTSSTQKQQQNLSKDYTTYVVKKGDSLWLISRKFPEVSVEQIKKWNNIWSAKSLKPGMTLKIFKS